MNCSSVLVTSDIQEGPFLYLPIGVLRALLDDLGLSRREVEQGVDVGVQVGLHPHDRLGAGAVFGAAGLEPLLPVVAVLERNIAPEDFLDLIAEGGKVQLPPG